MDNENIKILQLQTGVDLKTAHELLNTFNNNVIDAIYSVMNTNIQDTKNNYTEINSKFKHMREILDSKDKLYNSKLNNN